MVNEKNDKGAKTFAPAQKKAPKEKVMTPAQVSSPAQIDITKPLTQYEQGLLVAQKKKDTSTASTEPGFFESYYPGKYQAHAFGVGSNPQQGNKSNAPAQMSVKEEEEQKSLPKQGKGMAINDSPELESEADAMGKSAAEGKSVDVVGKGSGMHRKEEDATADKQQEQNNPPLSETNIEEAVTEELKFEEASEGEEKIDVEKDFANQEEAKESNEDENPKKEDNKWQKRLKKDFNSFIKIIDAFWNANKKKVEKIKKRKQKRLLKKEKKKGPSATIIISPPKGMSIPVYKFNEKDIREVAKIDKQIQAKIYLNMQLEKFPQFTIIPGKNEDLSDAFLVETKYCGSWDKDDLSGPKGILTQTYGIIWTETLPEKEAEKYQSATDKKDNQSSMALLRSEDSFESSVIRPLETNTKVFVIDSENGWAHVRLDDDTEGYVQSYAIRTMMPTSESQMYKIQDGDSVEKLIEKFYPDAGDKAHYANVLFFVNNRNNDKGGSIVLDQSKYSVLRAVKIRNYDDFKIIKGKWIWIPEQDYASSLKLDAPGGDLLYEVNKYGIEKFDKFWPVGLGFEFEGEVGITWGIPLATDMGIKTIIHRKDEDTLVVRKFANMESGFDTGAGADFKFKVGKAGVQADAGVHGAAMGQYITDVEYAFPIKTDYALMSFLMSQVEIYELRKNLKSLNPAREQVFAMLNEGFGVDFNPDKYLKKAKNGLGAYIDVDALASAGLLFGDDKKKKKGQKKFFEILEKLKIKAQASAKEGVLLGTEWEIVKWNEEENTVEELLYSSYIEGGVESQQSIPFAYNVSMAGSLAKKTTFRYKNGEIVYEGQTLTAKSGDIDYLNGPASQGELSSNDINKNKIELLDYLKYLQQVKIKKRFSIIQISPFLKHKKLLNKFNSVPELSKEEKQGAVAISRNTYLTVDLDFSQIDIHDKKLNEFSTAINDKRHNISELIKNNYDFMTKGIFQDDNVLSLFNIIAGFDIVKQAEWTVVWDFAAAGAVKAAAGAKIRGEGRGEFSKFKTTDLLEEIKEILTGEKAQFLSELFSQQPGEDAEEEKTQNTEK